MRGDVSGWQVMADSSAKLTPKQEQAILALLQGGAEQAARAANIGPRTLYRWQNDPGFQEALRKARRAAFSHAIARLQQGSGPAVSTLLKVMVDPKTQASTKVRAAECVLNHAAKAIEIEDIEARVAEV